MKKIYTLLFSIFWLLVFSQNPVLFNKNWKVQKIIINNNTIDAPADPSGYFISFYNSASFSYSSKLCSENYGNITYSTNSDDFIITSAKTYSNGCTSTNIADFDSKYSLFFTKYEIPATPNKITYVIEQTPIGYKLTIENIDGDQIIYNFYSPPSDLVSNTWSIASLDINNIHYNKPSQHEGGITTITSEGGIITNYFNTGGGSVGFYTDNKFQVLSLAVTLVDSNDPQISQFDGLYFDNFFSGIDNRINPYTYNITNNNEQLIITKYNGDKATYNRKFLSTSETSKSKISVYPNPATDIVVIENLKPYSSLELIDNTGKLVKSISNIKTTKTEINIKNLASGIYYLKVDGQSVQKIIKK